jgi:hypothetical protein
MTTVSACFFTLSTPTVSVTKVGGTGQITLTATNASCPYNVSSNSPFVTITSGASGTGSGTITFSVSANNRYDRTTTVNIGGVSFTVAQTGISKQFNVGYFQSTNGPLWVLNANGTGVFGAGDKFFAFGGQAGAIAFSGDWNGDGRSKVGYYLNGFWVLDYDGDGVFTSADKFYAFGGGAGYLPVVGDWNGDGRTKIGVYHLGFWALDINGSGTFDAGDGFYPFGGNPGETPMVGDWNGDGRSKIGYMFNGTWVLDYNGDGAFTSVDKYYNNFTYAAGDKAVVGDWNGDGKTKIGIYRNGFWILDANGNGTYDGVPGGDKFYGFGGRVGDVPLVADWNGDGRSKIGIYNAGFWVLDVNGNGTFDAGDKYFPYGGAPGNQPLVGRW